MDDTESPSFCNEKGFELWGSASEEDIGEDRTGIRSKYAEEYL